MLTWPGLPFRLPGDTLHCLSSAQAGQSEADTARAPSGCLGMRLCASEPPPDQPDGGRAGRDAQSSMM